MTHRNADATLKRTDLIEAAYRKIGVPADLVVGVQVLNSMLREESGQLVPGQRLALWGLQRRAIKLVASQTIYKSGNGLATDIREIDSVAYRNTSGDDTPITLVSRRTFDALADKNESGDPEYIYLLPNLDLTLQELWVWPAKTSVGTTSEVVGSDGENYICVMGHTAAARNRPTSGSEWSLYWDQQGTAGATWASGTAYTNGACLIYTYRRPLFDFDNPTDNPDFPPEWTRYLVYRLASDLAPDYGIALDERQWLEAQALLAREKLFPGITEQAQDFHNKVLFY